MIIVLDRRNSMELVLEQNVRKAYAYPKQKYIILILIQI